MNHWKNKAAVFALCLVLSIMTILPAAAVSPLHNASSEYLVSPYHAQLQSLTLTGDQRTDVVLVALSQLGYHEGNSDADMGGGSSGSRDFVEYNRLYGELDNGQGNGLSYGYSWCCAFATWCVKHAGVSTSVVKTEVSCDRLVDWFLANSTYKTKADGYTPRTGDLILFKNANSDRRHATHIGIVRYCEGNKVYTIEGNTNTANVAIREYNLTDSYIVGYAVPAYTSKPEVALDFSKRIPGTYFITLTSSSLNVRSTPSSANSNNIIGSVNYGEKITVTEIDGGWGKIKLADGRDGWIYLVGYAQYVPSARYTVNFNANGGTPAVIPSFPKQDGVNAVLPEDKPTRAGYTFAGWSTQKNATTAEYAAGGSFDLNADTTLYAVWAIGDFVVSFVNGDEQIQSGAYAHGTIVTPPATPTKPADQTYEYIFAGWDSNNDGKVDVLPDGKITASDDLVLRAVFTRKYVDYTIKFLGYGDSVISEKTYYFGAAVEIPAVPTSIDGKYQYVFDGWETAIAATVSGNATYRAKYKQELAKYEVSFVDGDGKVIAKSEYFYGDTVVIPAELPTKTADNTYTYSFKSWSPAVAQVIGNAVYTAEFDKTYIDYTVRFVDGNGKEIEIESYHYGDVPTLKYEGVVEKAADEMYEYRFTGWDKALSAVDSDVVYTATFESVLRVYTVTFFDDDGSVLSTAEYHYGDEIKEPTIPAKEGYRHIGWTSELGQVSGNASFEAVYEQVEVTTPQDTTPPDSDNDTVPAALLVSLIVVVILAVAFVAFIIVRKKKLGLFDD